VQTNLDLNTQAFVLVLGLVLGLVLVRKLRRLDLDNREVLVLVLGHRPLRLDLDNREVLVLVLVRKLRRLDLDNREVLDQAVVSLVVAFLLRPVGSVDRCSDRPDFVGTAQRVIDGPSEDPLFGGNPKFVVALGPVENSPS